jgi:hypothetical protein
MLGNSASIILVREVIANAVAHRDYSSTAAIQLRLDDSGLVAPQLSTIHPQRYSLSSPCRSPDIMAINQVIR